MSTPTSPSPAALLSSTEVAALLGNSPGSVRRWTRDGRIPHAEVSPSGTYRYDEAAVLEAVDRMRFVRRPAGTR